MHEKLKILIAEVVNMHNGYSDQITEMTCLGVKTFPFSHDEFNAAVKDLIDEGLLVPLNFSDPNSTRVKTILFAKGTVISLTELISVAEQPNQAIVVK
jgi:hypothetical protein